VVTGTYSNIAAITNMIKRFLFNLTMKPGESVEIFDECLDSYLVAGDIKGVILDRMANSS